MTFPGSIYYSRAKIISLSALGIKGLSEVTEEELQLVLRPLYRSIVLGEDYDAPEVKKLRCTGKRPLP